MTRNLRGFPLACLILSLFFCLAHCNSCGSSNPPPPEESSNPGGSNTLPSVGGGSGPSGNNPSDFPTVMAINFAAFPKDPGTCSGTRVYHVATNGNDGNPGSQAQPFRTIVKALQTAGSGDAILVRGGNYSEGAVDDQGNPADHRSLVLTQSNFALCAVSEETVTVSPRAGVFTYGMEITGNNVLVDGINLSGYPTSLIQLGTGTPLQNILLKNMTLTASGNAGKDGIATYNSQVNGLLISNVIVKNAFIGIQCNQGPCRNWRLDRVKVVNDPSQGDTGQDAIAIENGDNFLLSNVEVTGAAGDGLDFKGSNVAVFNANVHHNRRNGVKFWQGGDLVNSFVVNHGADAAVVFDHGGTYRILNSLIAYENFGGTSYTLTAGYDQPNDPLNFSIINSVFFNNAGAIWVSPATQVTLQNNLFTPTTSTQIFIKGNAMVSNGDLPTSLSQIGTASGNLDFNSNPLFTNPASGDFTFPNNSPLRNAGVVPNLSPSYDYRGQPRVLGGSPDLGPLELF